VFSSLLQADAAILGFGAIFIIYKIQFIENIRQNIIQSYYTRGRGYTNTIITLLLDNPEAVAAVLEKPRDERDFENLKYIVCIPAKANEIGRSIRLPIALIGGHTVFCGILLYFSQFLSEYVSIQNALLIVTLLWFALGVFLASRLAIDLLTRRDEYSLKLLRPDIFEFVTNKQEAKWQNR